MAPFIHKVIDADVPVLIYNGDTDIICNALHAQRFAADLGLPVSYMRCRKCPRN